MEEVPDPTTEEEFRDARIRIDIYAAITMRKRPPRLLTQRELLVLLHRFGLRPDPKAERFSEELSRRAIAEAAGVSGSRIVQNEKSALRRLRESGLHRSKEGITD